MPSQPRVILYARPGCHLCEEVGVSLDDILGPDSYATVDIERDDELLARYGHRIPVIAVDGIDRLEAPIAGPDLRGLIRGLNAH
ncbi:MAG: glutaredoxin family protein [Chloroflexota bacterium]|nr:glutaredoxin family protein [Chloroflexota bacterium]